MSLILVVDPDPRHAAQVASMARKHLKAEFVTADSGFRALEVLADRVPDIVLTAPLLPTRDEAVLSDYLRALGDAGAHVQTLTIPILSAAAAPQRGMRGRFRRDRSAPDSDGCDPEIFAEQVHQYLARAEKSRRVEPEPMLSVVEPCILSVMEPCIDDELAPEPSICTDIDLTPMLTELAEPERRPTSGPPPAAPDLRTRRADSADDDCVGGGSAISLRADMHPPARVVEAEIIDAPVDAGSASLVYPAPPHPAYVRRADAAALRQAQGVPSTSRDEDRSSRGGSAEPPASSQHLITIPAALGDRNAPATVNVAVAVSVQVAAPALRRADAAEGRSDRGGSAGPIARAKAKLKPVQDEWGFFDPDQCGFKALLSRLDAIAQEEGDS